MNVKLMGILLAIMTTLIGAVWAGTTTFETKADAAIKHEHCREDIRQMKDEITEEIRQLRNEIIRFRSIRQERRGEGYDSKGTV